MIKQQQRERGLKVKGNGDKIDLSKKNEKGE